MRMNIDLEDDLIQQTKEITGIKTTSELVHEALKVLIRLYDQDQVRVLRGKLSSESDLQEMHPEHLPEK